MEILNQIWQAIAPYVAGISVSGIISTIIYVCLRGAFNKTISKINVEKIADNATEKGLEKVKKVSFTHSIQPIVESELQKINEKALEVSKKTLEDVQAKYDQLILILEKLSAYFDNSIGVPDDAKAELKTALSQAKKIEPTPAESKVVEEIIVEEPKKTTASQETSKKTKVVR